MKFVDRTKELARIAKAINAEKPALIVVYGRRRVGKSTLIRHAIDSTKDIYFQADETQTANQLMLMAKAVGVVYQGFDRLVYPDWYALLEALNYRVEGNTTICLDEFPYLVKSYPPLPSVIQRFWDTGKPKFNLIMCGSSQQSMYSDILNASSPLYGRADCIIKLQPIEVNFIGEAMSLKSPQLAIAHYSLWGGIPRYWQLAERENGFEDAVKELLLSPDGTLSDEPTRLLRDDLRDIALSRTLLSIIGSGVNRLSEIAARMGKVATELSLPLRRLIEMGYVEREIPFGENPRNNKRSLYKIKDQFMNSYYRFVAPNASLITMGKADLVWENIQNELSTHIADEWEQRCRWYVSGNTIDAITYGEAQRWWGTAYDESTKKGRQMELDIVAQSIDGSHLLVGECKWAAADYSQRLLEDLKEKAVCLPFVRNYKSIKYLLCLREKPLDNCEAKILTPNDICKITKDITI